MQFTSDYSALVRTDLCPPPFTRKPFGKLTAHLNRIEADRALPYHCHTPTCTQQGFDCREIPLVIGRKFGVPEVRSGLRQPKECAAFMALSEAAMYEHQGVPFVEHQVRRPRKAPRMKSKAETPSPKLLSNYHLRLSVLGPDS